MLRLLFGGDTMLGRGVADVIRRKGPLHPLEGLRPTTIAADAFLVNLECAITERATRYSGPDKAFYFRADPGAIDVLISAGVDVVSLANNHALDADFDGLDDTLAILQKNDILSAGAGRSLQEASEPARWGLGEETFGMLAYCDHQADFAARTDRAGIRFVDVRHAGDAGVIVRDVRNLAKIVDHVVVAMHWQPNWVQVIRPPFRHLARDLAEAGARVVWGHSPHHFQGVEWLGDCVVLYSTGDLVDDYAVDSDFRNDRQLLFEVSIAGGVESVRALPLELDVGRTRIAEAEARRWIEHRFRSLCDEVGTDIEESDGWLEVIPR